MNVFNMQPMIEKRWDASEDGALKLRELKKRHKILERELELLTDYIDWT